MNKYFLRFHFLTLVNVRLTQSVLLAKLFRIWTPKESVSSMILKYFEASWDSFGKQNGAEHQIQDLVVSTCLCHV